MIVLSILLLHSSFSFSSSSSFFSARQYIYYKQHNKQHFICSILSLSLSLSQRHRVWTAALSLAMANKAANFSERTTLAKWKDTFCALLHSLTLICSFIGPSAFTSSSFSSSSSTSFSSSHLCFSCSANASDDAAAATKSSIAFDYSNSLVAILNANFLFMTFQLRLLQLLAWFCLVSTPTPTVSIYSNINQTKSCLTISHSYLKSRFLANTLVLVWFKIAKKVGKL